MADRFLAWVSAGILAAGLSVGALSGPGVAAADSDSSSAAASGPTSEAGSADAESAESRVEAESSDLDDAADPAEDEADEPAEDETDEPAEDGVSAAAVAGAGIAIADDGATGDGTGSSTSESTNSTDTDPDSAPDDAGTADVETEDESDVDETGEPVTVDADETDEPANDDLVEAPESEAVTRDDEPVADVAQPTVAPAADLERVAAIETQLPTTTEAEPSTASVTMSAVDEEEAPPAPTLINVIGTIFWSVFDFFAKVIEGPPVVPATFNVRVARSPLEIDCGDGYTVDADWYVPISQEPPTGLIYFQHGFGTRAGFYNITAASLAQSTNSIVVVPSITSNIFACDACHLTGDPMHFAVAKLFSGDRAALNASLAAAFPDDDIALPQKYVLAGHSGGSSFAAGVAGFVSQLGGPTGSPDLAGVILFDTNNIGEFVSRGIGDVPLSTPVYYIGAEPTLINNFDDVSAVMKELRPDQFTGVRLVGGTHADGIHTTNPLVSFVLNLALGPKSENVAAAEHLAAGWIKDMFSSGPDTGTYPGPGQIIEVATEGGAAEAVGLGGPLYQPSFFESLISLFYGQINNLRFGYCAADVDALLAEELANSPGTAGRVVQRSACAS